MVQLSLFLSHRGGAPSIRSPRTPTHRSEGGTRARRAAAAPRISRRCAPAELRIVAERGPAAAPGGPSSAQPLAGSRRGLRSRKLGPRALRPEDCSPSPERRVRSRRAREGANARMLLRRRAAARQGGLQGPQNKELSGGTYLRLWLSGPKSTDPRRRSGGRLGLPWMARLVAVCGRGGHGGARTGGGASGRGGERRTGGRVCGRRRRGPVRSLPPLQPAHQFQGSCNLIPLSHRP